MSKEPMNDSLLRVENLKTYFPVRAGIFSRVRNYVHAVDGVSFEIAPGKTLGLVGESGCGKTTTGRTILRLIEPTDGKIYFDGQDVTNVRGKQLRQLRRKMQMVFQDPYGSLNPRLTIRSIIEEGLIIHREGNRKERLHRVLEILEDVELDSTFLNRYPHECSGGQRQRVSIARALILRPKFLVLDEPISALDVSIQSEIINLLVELQQKHGLTYLFISHDLSVVEYLSDTVAVMYLGQIVEMAESSRLYREPLHPYTRALLAAVPVMDPKKRGRKIVLEGDVPSPLNPPSGCRFHPRCPLAKSVCAQMEPRMIDLDGHKVCCHAAEKQTLGTGPY